MSLQVWLPLNGDLRNLGCSNLQFQLVSTNTSIDTSGKIGSCYKNNSRTAGGIVSTSKITLGQQHSMFCWFKFTSLTSASTLGGGLVTTHWYKTNSGTGITIRYVSSTTGYLSVNTGNGSSRTYNAYYGTTLLQANTWYHGGFTYDGTNIKIYVNGNLEKTQAYANMSMPENYIGVHCWSLNSTTPHADYKFIGSINDVRIYDHCLSAAEVHEIAQGLVLHYKLDDITYGIEDSSGYNRNAISNGSQPVTIISDTPRNSASANFIAGARIATPVAASQYLPVDAITTNIWIKSSNAANRFLSCTESGGWNFESNGGYVRVPLYISGKGYTYCNSSTTTWSSLSDNQWHMLSFTYDRQQLKIYIDGTIDTTTDSAYPNINIAYRSNTPLTIGAESQTISSPIAGTYVGNISDLRIYCTALTADDILALYRTGAKIDNKQNLHCYEVEENKSKIAITKQGNVFCNELIEESATKFYNTNKLVGTYQIIEY